MPPLFIEVPVPREESERACSCLLDVLNLPFSLIFDFGIVSTVCFFLFFFCYILELKITEIPLCPTASLHIFKTHKTLDTCNCI